MTIAVHVIEEKIKLEDLVAKATTSECGAVLSFLGVVRDHADGKSVESIDYSCYREMAQKELLKVVEKSVAACGVAHAFVLHRIGRLAVGEASLGLVVASPHRRESFECGLMIIDELKKTVPIWKKEFGVDGSYWV
ncbi:MAG: molybdenum cofactor biosynthesis protein MoaE [Planctomycetota bacterium]